MLPAGRMWWWPSWRAPLGVGYGGRAGGVCEVPGCGECGVHGLAAAGAAKVESRDGLQIAVRAVRAVRGSVFLQVIGGWGCGQRFGFAVRGAVRTVRGAVVRTAIGRRADRGGVIAVRRFLLVSKACGRRGHCGQRFTRRLCRGELDDASAVASGVARFLEGQASCSESGGGENADPKGTSRLCSGADGRFRPGRGRARSCGVTPGTEGHQLLNRLRSCVVEALVRGTCRVGGAGGGRACAGTERSVRGAALVGLGRWGSAASVAGASARMAMLAGWVCHGGMSRRRLRGHLPVHLRNAKAHRTGGPRSTGRRGEPLTRPQTAALVASALPGVAALVALLFTWMQVSQNTKEVRISEHGEVTNRLNSAVQNLASANPDIRLGGIYALDRIMQDSPRDEPAVVSILSAYMHKISPRNPQSKEPAISSDLKAAVSVMGDRPEGSRAGPLVNLENVDLHKLDADELVTLKAQTRINFRDARLTSVDLKDAKLGQIDFTGAAMERADLSGSELNETPFKKSDLPGSNMKNIQCVGSDFTGALLFDADLSGANFNPASDETGCKLTDVDLSYAKLTKARLLSVPLNGTNLSGANLAQADFTGSDLRDVNLGGTEQKAVLVGTKFSHADLRGANLQRLDLSSCDLEGADLRGAHLDGARLKGAKLDGARGVPAGHG